MKKRLIAFCMALCMVAAIVFSGIGTSLPGNADYANAAEDEYAGYVYFTTEKVTLGQGFVIRPVKVGFYEGDTLADIADRALGDKSGYTESWGYTYLSSVIDGGEPNGWTVEDIPEKIQDAIASSGETLSTRNQADRLQEYDYSSTSGWMFGLNNVGLMAGAESYVYEGSSAEDTTYTYADGDVLRLQFSIYGWGMDLNTWDSSWGSDALISFPNKDALIRLVADYAYETDAKAYVEAMSVLEDWDATAEEVVEATDALETYISGKQEGTTEEPTTEEPSTEEASTEEPSTEENKTDVIVEDVLRNATDYIHNRVSDPVVSSIGGEWAVIALARYGYKDPKWYHTYYENVVDVLTSQDSNQLSNNKSTENSRAIIALTAIGADPTDVNGYDLTAPLLSMRYVTRQGVNGGIYALLALDTAGYEFSETIQIDNDSVSRESLIEYILSKKLPDGGWALSGGDAAIDVTAMAIQALAPYYDQSAEVKEAVDQALVALSEAQLDDGSFICNGEKNAESIAQVITALCVLGINPKEDENYIKNGNSAIDALLSFYDKNTHAFRHTTAIDQMSTEQAVYALVAYDRLLKGKNSLYDMSDAEVIYIVDTNDPSSEEDNTGTTEDDNTGSTGSTENAGNTENTGDTGNAGTSGNTNGQNNSVKTGDDTMIMLWMVIFAVSGLGAFLIEKKRRQSI